MGRIVTVTTGARLHFGPLAAAGTTGGRFGGLGMMISTPQYRISARLTEMDCVVADAETAARTREFLKRIRESTPEHLYDRPCHIEIHEAIPTHAGFGSGTQLGLAIARAIAELHEEREISVDSLARRTGRGLRSAIGLHGFAQGGFLVDGGRVGSGRLGVLVARVEFPSTWRLLLVAPNQTKGLSGAEEQRAFAAQPPMPQTLTAELCRIALMDWLPGLLEADFDRVSHAMYDFGLGVGRFFEPVQGGVFAHPSMRLLADEVRRRGFAGVAQTSWGPTICILCDSNSTATELANDLAQDSRWSECLFQVAHPRNEGARVSNE